MMLWCVNMSTLYFNANFQEHQIIEVWNVHKHLNQTYHFLHSFCMWLEYLTRKAKNLFSLLYIIALPITRRVYVFLLHWFNSGNRRKMSSHSYVRVVALSIYKHVAVCSLRWQRSHVFTKYAKCDIARRNRVCCFSLHSPKHTHSKYVVWQLLNGMSHSGKIPDA